MTRSNGTLMARLARALPRRGLTGRVRRDESGSATVEFVILMPVFIIIFLSTFELGMLMTRHVMLDRALDLTVREVRLGVLTDATHAELVDEVCNNVIGMAHCNTELKLAMHRVDPRLPLPISVGVDCANRDDPGQPPATYEQGGRNQLMILRVCALYDPFFPTTGLGASIPKMSGGAYALLATSSYVIEPF